MLGVFLMRTSGWLFLSLLSVFVFFGNGRFGGDGFVNYLTAESLWLDHDLSIQDRPFQVAEVRPSTGGVRRPDGQIASGAGIGMPLLLVPFYALGDGLSRAVPGIPRDYVTLFTVSLANPLFCALSALLLFWLLAAWGMRSATCAAVTAIFAFSTMVMAYARSGFSEPAAMVFELAALVSLFQFERARRLLLIPLAGALLGFAFLVKRNSVLFIPPVLVYAGWLGWKEGRFRGLARALALLGTPLAIAAGAWLWVRSSVYGGFSAAASLSAGQAAYHARGGGEWLRALYYYFLSSGKGFFWYNLPLLLGAAGIPAAFRRNAPRSGLILGLILIHAAFYAHTFHRGSLFSWGPRYLLPIVPLGCLFLAEWVEAIRKGWHRLALGVLAVLGFLVQLPAWLVNSSNFYFFVRDHLKLEEYLVNFVPDLSPIRGAWLLLGSAVSRLLGGASWNFVFSPDEKFVAPIAAPLAGFDGWDLWWVHLVEKAPDLRLAAAAALAALVVLAGVGLWNFRKGES